MFSRGMTQASATARAIERSTTPATAPSSPLPCTPYLVSTDLRIVKTVQAPGWAALGDPTRRAIFEYLADRPRPVAELARELPVSRPAVSQHLKVLKNAQLVIDQRAGTQRIYRVDPRGLDALRVDVERFWKKALTAYKSAVEHRMEDL